MLPFVPIKLSTLSCCLVSPVFLSFAMSALATDMAKCLCLVLMRDAVEGKQLASSMLSAVMCLKEVLKNLPHNLSVEMVVTHSFVDLAPAQILDALGCSELEALLPLMQASASQGQPELLASQVTQLQEEVSVNNSEQISQWQLGNRVPMGLKMERLFAALHALFDTLSGQMQSGDLVWLQCLRNWSNRIVWLVESNQFDNAVSMMVAQTGHQNPSAGST